MEIPQIHLIIPNQTAETTHAATLFFRDICGFSLTISDMASNNNQALEVEYAPFKSTQGLFIKQTIHPSDNPALEININNHSFPYPTDDNSMIPFDPIALTWLLLFQRREQLNKCDFDIHHRPKLDSLWITKQNIAHFPLIDIAANLFIQKIKSLNPETRLPMQKSWFEPTFDIDIAFAHKAKPLLIHGLGSASLLLNRDFSSLKKRFHVWSNKNSDPYDVFNEILAILDEHKLHAHFFAMTANRSKYDHNNYHRSSSYRKLLQLLSEKHTVGLHPGYASATNTKLLKIEKERLENIIGKPVTHIRQHYLRQYLPLSWHEYIEQGFTDDYSVGYATNSGYSVGTCKSYQAFDLIQQKPLPLTLHPFALMDTALSSYQKKSSAEVIEITQHLHDNAIVNKAPISAVWHNYAMPFESEALALFLTQISVLSDD